MTLNAPVQMLIQQQIVDSEVNEAFKEGLSTLTLIRRQLY